MPESESQSAPFHTSDYGLAIALRLIGQPCIEVINWYDTPTMDRIAAKHGIKEWEEAVARNIYGQLTFHFAWNETVRMFSEAYGEAKRKTLAGERMETHKISLTEFAEVAAAVYTERGSFVEKVVSQAQPWWREGGERTVTEKPVKDWRPGEACATMCVGKMTFFKLSLPKEKQREILLRGN